MTGYSESGDKLTRFGPFSSQCRAGNIKVARALWNEDLFRALEGFPDLAHDDEVDACSGALEMLNPPMKDWGLYEVTRQRSEELDTRKAGGGYSERVRMEAASGASNPPFEAARTHRPRHL